MAFQYDNNYSASAPLMVPVAVPFPISTNNNGDTPTASARPPLATSNMAHKKSNYQLPSSRRNGAFAPVPEHQIQQLVQQGYTRGHATSLAQTIRNFPLRIWVVDNSGSMQKTDGHRFVETKRTQDVKVVNCSRWSEIQDCIEYHAQMAAALEAPTTFRMLNDPSCGPNSQQFGIAETSLDSHVLQEEVDRAITIMKTAQPGGVTPLVQHIEEIAKSVKELEPQLRADGCRVVIILATDGLPTDERGYGGAAIQQQFVEALRGLEGLPVWVVVRLCTDEDKVVEFYNDLDGQLELSLEVLDDFIEEANEVHEHNPWLNYALPLHRLREMGYHHRIFDMMDERPFTHEELRNVAELEPQLRADGCRVAIILATDGLPTDERGYGGAAIQQHFLEALRGLEGLPVWVVIRLCTDEDSVVQYYNDLDGQLELSLEVLDDFLEEAKEIYDHNPWLNYALPLHRLREMGYHHRIFDMMDERPFTHEELREHCSLLLINNKTPSDELPDPSADWKEFSKTVKNLLAKQQGQWNPIKKKVTPWIDVKQMDKIMVTKVGITSGDNKALVYGLGRNHYLTLSETYSSVQLFVDEVFVITMSIFRLIGQNRNV
eukprot:CAMPEP_0201947568 /NCGR_PEP_ID=MMETSP0903-20130614/55006_1 /ASSEMBLY_ACC=CAM_ASM_000552 /TAXON_ID=420261 /ORGANISM="Thalassiosira antarctica, Strain CCMP982" /LENGTH=602 /DNA_ID=CAMNT_0048490713 /DNA_START=141 /DNA_END=1951 /DNA_ORIENTATION=+